MKLLHLIDRTSSFDIITAIPYSPCMVVQY